MFEITDEDLEALIDKYRGRKPTRGPIYNLKELVQHGFMYLYGDAHFQQGRVRPCRSPFSLYQSHTCNKNRSSAPPAVSTPAPSIVTVQSIEPLKKSEDAVSASWAGYNLALLTSAGELYAYFKKELLFKKDFSEACLVKATSSKIFVGMHTGDIVVYDPVSQTKSAVNHHTDAVTCILPTGNTLISGSLDGTVFFKKSYKLTDSSVLDIKCMDEHTLACSCSSNDIIVLEDGNISTFSGHKSKICNLSHNKLLISSSEDGYWGLLYKTNSSKVPYRQNMQNMGCSMHKLFTPSSVLGYGLNEVSVIDINTMEKSIVLQEAAMAADVHGHAYVYATGEMLNFRDTRSQEKCVVNMHKAVCGLHYSIVGDILLVTTTDTPYLLDLRYANT